MVYSFLINQPSSRSIELTSSRNGVDRGNPSSGCAVSRCWYPAEKVTIISGRRLLISSSDILSERDSRGSILTVKAPAGSVPDGNWGMVWDSLFSSDAEFPRCSVYAPGRKVSSKVTFSPPDRRRTIFPPGVLI